MIMKFRKNNQWLSLVLSALLLTHTGAVVAKAELRVCADPDNLPFSNRKQEGFENKIAAILASQLHAKLSYTWQRQKSGFIRQTLGADRCDVVMGVPYGYERVLSTQPYYWSGYVFVAARNRHLSITSFDDPILHQLKIGLHGFGKDGSNSPPASALAVRGITENIVGYSMWGDASVKNPQALVIDAVAKGDIDLAIVWGPIAGYYAKKYGNALELTLAPHDPKLPDMPFDYEISLGVRKTDQAFAEKLEKILEQQRSNIHEILTTYNIPLIQPLKGPALSDMNTD
jgi:quinoprotein dehydrogenase-associated probable ABC transporter substrate-binding protein